MVVLAFQDTDYAMPEEQVGRWGEEGVGRRTPYELLQVLLFKVDRFDLDLQAIRKDMEQGRDNFRREVREEITELKARLIDPVRYSIVEKLVFGLVGIVLVAVLTLALRVVFMNGALVGH